MKRRWIALTTGLIGSVGMALLAPPALAHPHNYIEVEATVVIEDGVVRDVRYVWRFDRAYLDSLKDEYDANRDGVIADDELQTWLAASRKNLETFKFFTTLRSGSDVVPLGGGRDYRADKTEDGGVALQFTVRPSRPVDVRARPLEIDIYDKTFFTEFVLGDGGKITVEASGRSGTCAAAVALAPGGEQQKAITAFMKMFGRVDAKLSPAKAIIVACRD